MQVKKDAVRDKISTATMRLLEKNRYLDTTIPKIAKIANVSPANIYRYYSLKFKLFYDVLDPWLNARFDAFEERAFGVSDPKERFELTLRFMWIDLPEADNCFPLNLIEALAAKREKDRYSRNLLLALERRYREDSGILPRGKPARAPGLGGCDPSDLHGSRRLCSEYATRGGSPAHRAPDLFAQ